MSLTEIVRHNFSSPLLWELRQKFAYNNTLPIAVTIEQLNRIDLECASAESGTAGLPYNELPETDESKKIIEQLQSAA